MEFFFHVMVLLPQALLAECCFLNRRARLFQLGIARPKLVTYILQLAASLGPHLLSELLRFADLPSPTLLRLQKFAFHVLILIQESLVGGRRLLQLRHRAVPLNLDGVDAFLQLFHLVLAKLGRLLCALLRCADVLAPTLLSLDEIILHILVFLLQPLLHGCRGLDLGSELVATLLQCCKLLSQHLRLRLRCAVSLLRCLQIFVRSTVMLLWIDLSS
mmetsp:Transcript_83181/g.231982  ORF Transcript_83181/g.231982 Transcript_83181/m.231982 type:complete len:217 (+) Transcript_83181:1296-1946(+)